jgi:2,4-didehydro-3-deoxy-L-rhamnonate hydrolase
MRLANLNGRAVIVTDDGVVDVAKASGGAFSASLPSLYTDWARFMKSAAKLDLSFAQPYDQTNLGAPSPQPRQVFGIGLNYADHAAETGREAPSVPAVFTKFPTSLTGPFATVALSGEQVDYECEVVVVIGAPAHRVSVADADSVIAGLCVGQDLSDRAVQYAAGNQFSLGKSYPGYAPTGPWLVTYDEFRGGGSLRLTCQVNGELRQDGSTADLLFSIPQLIARLSETVTLLPGDLIFTGTPAGVGMAMQPPQFLRAGDVITSTVEGIGTIVTTMGPLRA